MRFRPRGAFAGFDQAGHKFKNGMGLPPGPYPRLSAAIRGEVRRGASWMPRRARNARAYITALDGAAHSQDEAEFSAGRRTDRTGDTCHLSRSP